MNYEECSKQIFELYEELKIELNIAYELLSEDEKGNVSSIVQALQNTSLDNFYVQNRKRIATILNGDFAIRKEALDNLLPLERLTIIVTSLLILYKSAELARLLGKDSFRYKRLGLIAMDLFECLHHAADAVLDSI